MAERTNPQVEYIIGAQNNASPVFNEIAQRGRAMGDAVERGSVKAGEAVGRIGDKAAPAAGKVDNATKSIIASIERATAAMRAGERGSASYFEELAKQRNISGDAIKPYIESLKAAQAAQNSATASMSKMGVSAKQTAAALRGVPAQITDIVTSLQGGQAPFTVLLQQGGQLKDMFGGIAPAARALGSTLLTSLASPAVLAAVAVAALTVAYYQGSKEADAYRLALVTTGNAAGTSTALMQRYAQAISAVAGTQGKAAEAVAAIAATGRVSGESLQFAAQAAAQWERTTGTAVTETAKKFAELAKSPLAATIKLNEEINFLTESVYRQIKSLDDQGKTSQAAEVAQRAYAEALNSRSATITQNLGYIEAAWKGVASAAKKSWDAMLNVGRQSTAEDAASELRSRLAKQQEELRTKRAINPAADTSGLERGIEVLKERLGLLESDERQTRRLASAEAQRASQMQALAEWDKEGAKYLNDKAKLQKELTKAQNEGVAAGRSQSEIDERLAKIRESYAKKDGASTDKEAARAAKDLQDSYAALSGVTESYTKDLATYQAQRAAGTITEQQYVQLVEQLISKQPFVIASEKEYAHALKETARAYEEASKPAAQALMDRQKAAQAAEQQLTTLRNEEEAANFAATANITLAEAVQRLAVARAQEAYDKAASAGSDGATLLALQREIEARRELVSLTNTKSVREASADAAKDAAREWKRASDEINNSLTDALMRGFESGKDFAKNMRDTVVNMFKTMVLRPVISAVLSPVAGAVNGVVGNAVGGAAGSGIGSGIATSIGTSAIGSAFSLGLTNFGTGLGSTLANGLVSGFSTNVANFSTLAGAGNLSGALGVAAPYLAGIGAIYAIAKSLDDSGTYHTGGAAQYSAAGGLMSGQSGAAYNIGFGRVEAGAESIKAVGGIAQALGTALDGVAVAFGQKAGYEIATAFADDTSEDGAWGALRISRDGQDLLNWEQTRQSRWAPREFGDGQDGYNQYLAAVAKDTRQVLLDMDLPGWADTVLNAIGDSPSIEDISAALTQIGQAQAAFKSFGQYMTTFATLADSSVTKLAAASGGIGALAGNMSTFVDQFYSDSEKLAVNTANVREAMGKLGFELPATRDEFKALVQAQLALGDAGAETAAGLLGLSGAFAAIVPAAYAVTESVKAMTASLDDYISSNVRDSAQSRYLRGLEMVGNTAELKRLGIPGYASGGYHPGGLRLVGENGPELEVTGPSHIISSPATAALLGGHGGDTATVTELKGLRSELQAEIKNLRAEVRAVVVQTAKAADIWERVTPGRNSISIATPYGPVQVATPAGQPLSVDQVA